MFCYHTIEMILLGRSIHNGKSQRENEIHQRKKSAGKE